MFSIGNDELERLKDLETDTDCPNCGEKHPVLYGKAKQPDGTWVETAAVAFVKCPETGHAYLVGIGGKRLNLTPPKDRGRKKLRQWTL